MTLQVGLFDSRDTDGVRRAYAAHAMASMLETCVTHKGKEDVPRMLSASERMLIAAQSFLLAEAMIDAEALQVPELEELLKESAKTR